KTSLVLFLLSIAAAIVIGSRSFNSASKEAGIFDSNESGESQEAGISATEETDDSALSEEEFNNSGQAKAIEKESDLWPVFEDAEVGFSVHYPQDANLVDQKESVTEADGIYYKIDVRDFGEGDLPRDLSAEEAQKNVESLSSGEFGINHENSLELSQKVRSVGFLFAQDFMVLSRFDVCSVTMERTLLFYFNNKQISITAYAPINVLQKTMPEYFISDKENCGEQSRWNFDKQNEFYQQLADKKAPADIQQWFDNFDKMAETIIFDHR
ncbi:MAG: hypothetical protein WC180_06045, partial [Candidatus Paceibacterota bacterium]